VLLLAACGGTSTEEKVTWALILGVPTLAYLAAVIVPIARARGERRYVVPLCLGSAAFGAGLLIAGGFDDDLYLARVVWALAIGALLGAIAFAFRRRRLLTYLLMPLLSGGVAGLGLLLLFFGALAFTDACLD
jgi:hypothetical protein